MSLHFTKFEYQKREKQVINSMQKKNIDGLVQAYSKSSALRNTASLVLCIRGIDNPKRDIVNLANEENITISINQEEQTVLNDIRESNINIRNG